MVHAKVQYKLPWPSTVLNTVRHSTALCSPMSNTVLWSDILCAIVSICRSTESNNCVPLSVCHSTAFCPLGSNLYAIVWYSKLYHSVPAIVQVHKVSPSCGGDVVLCVKDINQPSLPSACYSVLVSIFVFMALSSVFHPINSPDNSLLSRPVLLSYFCLTGPSFRPYISLRRSPSAQI